MILSEDFDNPNLLALKDCDLSEPGDLSIVDDGVRGKVLKISHKGGRFAGVYFKLNPAKVSGKNVRVSCFAKLPGFFVAVPDKSWAQPKVSVTFKDKTGKDYTYSLIPEAGRGDWQPLVNTFPAPKDCTEAKIGLAVELVAAEIFFDSLSITADTDIAAPATPAGQAAAPAPTPITPPTANKINPPSAFTAPAGAQAVVVNEMAAKAPKKTMEENGLIFGPIVAMNLQKVSAGQARKNSLLWAGPGILDKELAKSRKGWTAQPIVAKVNGPSGGSPQSLLASLPEILSKDPPEVILLAGEAAPSRKPSSTENEDWLDVVRLCLRMGSVPVMVFHPAAGNEEKDAVRDAMMKVVESAGCPAIAAKPADLLAMRTTHVVSLIEKYVLGREQKTEPGATVRGGPGDE